MFNSFQRVVFVVVLAFGVLLSSSSAASFKNELVIRDYRVKRDLPNLPAVLSSISTFVQAAIGTVDSLVTAVGQFGTDLSAALGIPVLGTLLNTATDLVSTLLNTIGSLLGGILGRRRRDAVTDILTNAVKAALTAVTDLSGTTVTIATDTLTALKAELKAKLDEIQALLNSATGDINLSTVNGLVQDVLKLGNKLIGTIATIQGDVNKQFGDIIDKIQSITGNLNDAVGAVGDLKLSSVTTALVKSIQDVTGTLGKALTTVQSTVTTVDQQVQKITGTLVEETQAVVGDLDTLLSKTVQNVICQ